MKRAAGGWSAVVSDADALERILEDSPHPTYLVALDATRGYPCVAVNHAGRAGAGAEDPTELVRVNASAPLLVREAEATRLLKSVERPMVVELTEREQVDDYDALRTALDGLAPGARIAVDDAGAGYASLRHILALEPDFIKLDTSWVRDLDHDDARQALVAGLGYFAQRTHCALVAEGVEREGEADALRRLGVAFGQGYLFGTPEPIDHWT